MASRKFKPGDQVVWWKQTPGGGHVVPVRATVLAVTPKRVKIEAQDEEGDVIRHVFPKSIEHHVPATRTRKKPPAAKGPRRTNPSASSPLLVLKRRSRPARDEVREERITMEIVVDAYNEDERRMGWYCYLESKLDAPFLARCIEQREVSPLSVGDKVEVVGMPPERDCRGEMFVSIAWGERTLAVPLVQLEVVEADDETREAVEVWHYWVAMGYEF